ncbi:thermonuclease family protein [Desulfovibrio sp. TomC]|uniref:thermonuclease family protein n=1 Tax=Desulfovibrio sp. TomC TaxID=1562888 RepID=UPI0005B772BC|nr:thermonuclease family protein [Desulfovibrio sp. TomC]
MKIFIFSIFFSMMMVATPALATENFSGKVVTVVDGATLDIAKPDGQIERIRLFATAVPQAGAKHAEAATKRTTFWCHQWDNVAEVIPMGQGKDGVAVARVIVGQEEIANVLAKACLARVNMKLCRDQFTPECVGWNAWELQCRDEKKGLWSE